MVRREFAMSAGYDDLNSKVSSHGQQPRIWPRTVKTGCGVFRCLPAVLDQRSTVKRSGPMEIARLT
jgi:hypothetical protein